ncbi:MAG: DUF1003 domain-containing protein [Candidatus Doudnabacteria bacterium]|nr:DUF1003 domain-containing protein [Candidatus Doudnabacteria bacterium]
MVKNLNQLHKEKMSLAEKSADALSVFVGSWRFILLLGFFMLIWIALNVAAIELKWDPYPFILLNLFLSVAAAVQAPIILMSQNRMEKKDRLRAELDYETDLKAEHQIVEIKKDLAEIKAFLQNKKKKSLTK